MKPQTLTKAIRLLIHEIMKKIKITALKQQASD